ncbi:carbon starvation protein A, partial [Candidatus Poribacteria bacterium]|nr:carbon starvation protein A [Candidatus Poribacteria bacterium]
IDPARVTPAHTLKDGTDYVPTKREVLLGHHFTSIAGTGPIVGPAIAIIWGWVPALLWVVFGSIFIGAVHDFGALVLSVRHRGTSIGDLAGTLVNPRVRRAFLSIIVIALYIVLAVFTLVIANIFALFPQSVIPIWIEIPIAVALGYWMYQRGKNHVVASIIAAVTLYVFVVIGAYVPVALPPTMPFGLTPVTFWSITLFIYAYIASVLPVQKLLQPRDYINGHELYIAMALLVLGLIVAHPPMIAPTYHPAVADGPPIFPFVFITIACGAISGFHCMVSSSTTSKQLSSESHAQTIGYGAMLMEAALATLVIVACGAALGLPDGRGAAAFAEHYPSWQAAGGLKATLGAFVSGSAALLESLGIPQNVAIAIMGVMVASFAGTTLDTATRIQRYVISELATDLRVPILQKRHPATFVAVATAAVLAFQKQGTGGLLLWPLFGTANQLMGALALMIVTVWLARNRKPIVFTALPMLFMVAMSGWALIANLAEYASDSSKWYLLVIGGVIAALELWMIVEIAAHVASKRGSEAMEGTPGA